MYINLILIIIIKNYIKINNNNKLLNVYKRMK